MIDLISKLTIDRLPCGSTTITDLCKILWVEEEIFKALAIQSTNRCLEKKKKKKKGKI